MFSVQKVSIFYDVRQDRLNLLFFDHNEQMLLGFMTRHLLKGLLAALPEWLARNIKQAQGHVSQNEVEQRGISLFNYQAAQQNISAVHGDIEMDKVMIPFMIETINLAKSDIDEAELSDISLSFIDDAKSHQIVLALSLAQFHKLTGEMLAKVDNWGLKNPWGGGFVGVAANMVH